MGFFSKLFGEKVEPIVPPPVLGATPQKESARQAPIVSKIIAQLGQSLRPGMRTSEVAAHAVRLCEAHHLEPRMLGFRGFPAPLALSINEEVVHGIPGAHEIDDGDLVKIQLGTKSPAGTADQGWTFLVGNGDEQKRRLMAAGQKALHDAIATIRTASRVGDIGAAVQAAFEAEGFNAIRDFVGYAIGAKPIEDPQLPCYGKAGLGKRFEDRVILHVHAIGCAGAFAGSIRPDKWTFTTDDRSPAVLFTAMVRVHATGCDVLTSFVS